MNRFASFVTRLIYLTNFLNFFYLLSKELTHNSSHFIQHKPQLIYINHVNCTATWILYPDLSLFCVDFDKDLCGRKQISKVSFESIITNTKQYQTVNGQNVDQNWLINNGFNFLLKQTKVNARTFSINIYRIVQLLQFYRHYFLSRRTNKVMQVIKIEWV